MDVWRDLILRLLVIVVGGLAGAGAVAQDLGAPVSSILTVDSERVFRTTNAGRQITADLEAQLDALGVENRRIEAELVAEELDLTERRATMDPFEFRVLADEFDKKVQRIRTEQDAKQRALQQLRETGRQSFIDAIAPILSRIGRARGAVVILERRNVLLSADNIDITDEAIARINATIAVEQAPGDDATDEATPEQATEPETTQTSE